MKNYKAHIALILANVFFGINFPVAKSLMPDFLHPIEIIILRTGVSSLLFWLISRFFYYEKTERKDILRLALCGLFGITINQLMFFEGLNLSAPIDASIILVSVPVMVVIISAVLIKEKITPIKIIGIIIGALGALITIIYGKTMSVGSDPIRGNIYLFINAFCYSIYFVIVKPLMAKYNAFTVMKWTFLFGFLFVIPFSYHSFSTVNWASFSFVIWSSLAYVIIATTFLAYLFIAYAMKFVNSGVASFYIYFQPIVASMLAIIIYNENITFVKILSAAMIFIGVYLVGRRSKEKNLAQKSS